MQNYIWKIQNKRRGGEAGFTLIELLIVILILGVLATIVVLAVNGFNKTGESAACKTTAKSIESAAAAGYADSTANPKAFPASIAAMVSAGYLKEAPPASMGVSYNNANGTASCT